MINMDIVQHDVYYKSSRVVEAIEDLNRAGFKGISLASQEFRLNDGSVPIVITNPLQELASEPLSSFDEFILRSFGAANGLRTKEQLVLSALVAEVTQKPVISIPFPNRDWTPVIPDKTKGWSKMTATERRISGVSHLDAYADHALDVVEQFITSQRSGGKVSAAGESLGAALALSLFHQATNFDQGDVSVLALPNSEKRHLYRELFFGDFLKSADGMEAEGRDSSPELQPLIEAHGYDKNKGKIEENIDGLRYLTKDLFGLFPFDPQLKLYKANRSLTRSLTVPTAVSMINRLIEDGKDTKVHLGFFMRDAVAKYEAFNQLAETESVTTNTSVSIYPGGHSACNNPSIIGYAATKLR